MSGTNTNLLNAVTTAHDLMHRIADLQNHINQLSTRLKASLEEKKGRNPILYTIAGILIAFTLITSTPLKALTYAITLPFYAAKATDLQLTLWNTINIILSVILGFFLGKIIRAFLAKRRSEENAYIQHQNAQVAANNKAVLAEIEKTKQAILSAQKRWAAEVAPWYPMDYDSLDAVDYFLSIVRNHRAETVAQMVNLYETELHQRRMEAGQQQMLDQQRIGNMLQMGNLLMQGRILNQAQQINDHTRSTSANMDWIARRMGKR